jgi:hypothetical protein
LLPSLEILAGLLIDATGRVDCPRVPRVAGYAGSARARERFIVRVRIE